MGKAWLVFGVLMMLGFAAVESANAPAPAVDCSTVILNMADCLSFVSNGSKESKPQSTCCSGLKTVLKTSAECLCEAFKNSGQYGIALNMTKALALPSACGVSASASKCEASSVAPAAAPAQSPALSPKSGKSPAATPSGSAPSPTTSGSITAETPAPAPGSSSASSVSIPSMLLFTIVVASFSFF